MKRPSGDRASAKKSLGQNFLSDANYITRIVAAVNVSPADTIIEIGPGRGALTEKLVKTGAEVITIELDRNLIEPLRSEFRDRSNFSVVENDALTANFGDLISDSRAESRISNLPSQISNLESQIPEPKRVKLVANLPYYISTAILQHLARQRENFSFLVLMFQREVVDRITAQPGSSGRGFLTVVAESAFQMERLFDVPPTAFRPVPKVWSSVLRLTPKPDSNLDEGSFRKLVSVAFAQKRKNIANNLKTVFPRYAEALSDAGIDPKLRAEALSLEDWQRLHHAILAA
jgi:16S rRNA (adenine1518-N6/adenine1519-N6)-dimethyltransferase